MKQIILIAILFFCSVNYVNGETYYGEYRRVEEIGEYKDDMLFINQLKLYNTYKINYMDLGYMEENTDYIVDKKDYKEEYKEITLEEDGDEYINIGTNISEEANFVIGDLKNNMKIYEIEIYINEEKVSYGVVSSYYKYMKKVMDNNFDTYLSGEELDRINLYTYKKRDIESFKIIIYTEDTEDYDLNIFLDTKKIPFTLKNKNKNKHIINFIYQQKPGYDITYEYKGIKKLFKHYKEEKEILNKYVDFGDNLLLDDYIEIDDYYVRDKLVLKDNIIINSLDEKIDDFIEYASGDVNINCNIDYNINQKYTCDFLVGDIFVTKDVIVDIPKKIVDDNIDKVLINKDNNYYVSNEDTLESKTTVLNNNTITTTKKITTRKRDTNNRKTTKEDNKINKELIINIVKYIIIVNLIIIEILLFIKKKRK